MTDQAEAAIMDYSHRSLRDTADTDYIAARVCYRVGLFDQFLWMGLQAIEKYIKATLLFHGQNIKGIEHNLTEGVRQLTKVPGIPWDFPPNMIKFLEYLTNHGQNRYFEIPKLRHGRELIQLDNAVWSIRRYCQVLDFTREWIDDNGESFFDRYMKWMSGPDCRKSPHSFQLMSKGYLEVVLWGSKHLDQRNNLIWKNLYYGRRHKRSIMLKLTQSSSIPAHYIWPGALDSLRSKIPMSKNARKLFEDHGKQCSSLEG